MEELWKPVVGYEGLYEVSNKGRVRSLPRSSRNNQGLFIRKGKILKPSLNSTGYERVPLTDQYANKRLRFVHRLVAEAFVPHATDEDVVNHKDFNPLNNCVDNLEWTTRYGNYLYSLERGRFNRTPEWKDNLRKSQSKFYKPVVGENVHTGEKLYFEYLNNVSQNGFQPSCVCNCCKGLQHIHKGYSWRYAETLPPDELEHLKEMWR